MHTVRERRSTVALAPLVLVARSCHSPCSSSEGTVRRALLLLALLVLVAGCGGSEGGGDEAGAAEAGSFAVLDRVVLPTRPGGIAAGTDSVWATNPEAGELVKVDATTARSRARTRSRRPRRRGGGGGSVWVIDPLASEIVHVDEATGEPVAHIPLANPAEISFGFGSLWAVEGVSMTRIDTATNRVVARVAMPGSVTALTVGDDAVWVVGRSRGFGRDGGWDLARIDPDTNRRSAEIELGEFVGANWVATTPGATWASVSSPDRYGLARIDSRTNRVLGLAPLSRTRFPFLGRIAADDRAVWFVSALSVGRIDPRTNRLTASVHANSFERRLAARPDYADLGAAVVLDGDLWVTDPGAPAIVRVGRTS